MGNYYEKDKPMDNAREYKRDIARPKDVARTLTESIGTDYNDKLYGVECMFDWRVQKVINNNYDKKLK